MSPSWKKVKMSNLRLIRNCLDIHNVFCLIIQSLYLLKYILHLKKHMSSSSRSIYAQKQENICARYYCLCLAASSNYPVFIRGQTAEKLYGIKVVKLRLICYEMVLFLLHATHNIAECVLYCNIMSFSVVYYFHVGTILLRKLIWFATGGCCSVENKHENGCFRGWCLL